MGMELAREVETVFGCTLDQDQLMEATSFQNSSTPEDTSDEIITVSSSPLTERVTVTSSELKIS
ncbi:hypothetical protein F4781DRAFT_429164 [Annulohypoxylon bovei var. microspora]|nr:hypothetical protein F4781DRAFT_429164 [Annulohypoxylon bovei var. microspora]